MSGTLGRETTEADAEAAPYSPALSGGRRRHYAAQVVKQYGAMRRFCLVFAVACAFLGLLLADAFVAAAALVAAGALAVVVESGFSMVVAAIREARAEE